MSGTLQLIRSQRPLVHAISNFVTANFCADILLAAGASPMMTDDAREAAEATQLADALYLNIGTLNDNSIRSMLLAGSAAKEKQIKIVFDPVGAGATQLRTKSAQKILAELQPEVVKGNLSEMLHLSGIKNVINRGVDAGSVSLKDDIIAETLKAFAKTHHCIAIATGRRDFVTDGEKVAVVHNGTPMLECVTGTGCALGALCAAAAATGKELFCLQLDAVLTMAIAGEIAITKISHNDCGTFKTYLLDAIGNLTDDDLNHRGKYEFLA